MHADDPRQAHQVEAQDLLSDLLDGAAMLCVDEGFDIDESKNQSLIGGEYAERLTAAHSATAVIAALFGTGRVRFVSRATPPGVKKNLEQTVRKKRDRTFLAVAYNSESRVLCSHDYEDMQSRKRKFLEKKTGIEVLRVSDTRTRMQ